MEQLLELVDIDLSDNLDTAVQGESPQDSELEILENLVEIPTEGLVEPSEELLKTQITKDDAFGLFLHEVARHPLLNHEQEIWLGIQIRAYDRLLSYIRVHQINSISTQDDLQSLVFDQLVQVQVAITHVNRTCKSRSLPMPDFGAIFSEIVSKRFCNQDPFPESLFEWLWELKAIAKWDEEFVRDAMNLTADLLVIPLNTLVYLSSQFNRWELNPISESEIKNLVRSLENIDLHLNELEDKGRQAKDRLILSNVRLVISVAKHYTKHERLEDLVQVGVIGLMRALKRYQPELKFRFSTYATWWIRQAVSRDIADNSRTIRIPVHAHDQLNRLVKLRDHLVQVLGRSPTLEEVAAEDGRISVEKLKMLFQIAGEPLSLDMPSRSDPEDSCLGDFIADKSPGPDHISTYEQMARYVDAVLQGLPPRECQLLKFRYGLNGDEPMTLDAVGQKLGVTRERVRQIEAQALCRLRHPAIRRKLREFLG